MSQFTIGTDSKVGTVFIQAHDEDAHYQSLCFLWAYSAQIDNDIFIKQLAIAKFIPTENLFVYTDSQWIDPRNQWTSIIALNFLRVSRIENDQFQLIE